MALFVLWKTQHHAGEITVKEINCKTNTPAGQFRSVNAGFPIRQIRNTGYLPLPRG
nr:hypothetical protein [Escherichia coli]